MCGFVGMYGPSAGKLQANLDHSLQQIAHRGRDSRGVYSSPDSDCFIAHQRLAILDLSEAANQPMVLNGSVLAYNGEIYNHQELRREELSEREFRTHSDTETLLLGIDRNGSAFLNNAAGMFAGAFYSEKESSLILFRDSLGIKPLYFCQLPDTTVMFASEIKGLLELSPELDRRCNLPALRLYMTYENFPQGISLFKGVSLLEPGVVMRLSGGRAGKVSIQRSHIENECGTSDPVSDDYDEIVRHTGEQITSAVKSHLMSDRPIGVYLSGGIDSSIVATLAAQNDADIIGFTGFFRAQDNFYDERPFSRLVAKAAEIELVEIEINPKDFTENLDRVIYFLDEPRMGMGSFSQYMVAMEAAKQRRVILAGHGGDELFGGYPNFKAFWLLQSGKLSQETLQCLRTVSSKEWPWVAYVFITWLRSQKLVYAPKLFRDLESLPGDDLLEEDFFATLTTKPLEQLSDYYLKTYLPGLLVVEDKISMAHTLETRVPLWSQELVAWARKIPIHLKLKGGQPKGHLLDVAREFLPVELLTAPKRGFPTPLRLWFRTDLNEFLHDRLLSQSPLHDLVPADKIRKLLSSHRNFPLPFALDERRAHRIWILLCLESWMRQFRVSLRGN